MSEIITESFFPKNILPEPLETSSRFEKEKTIFSDVEIVKNDTLQNYSATVFNENLKYVTPTGVAGVITSKPTLNDVKNNTKAYVKSAIARLREKTVTIQKVLDTYGVIDSIDYSSKESQINATVYDLETNELISEISFSSNEFSKSDNSRLVENAIFYWYVGFEKNALGQERRKSEFRLRRIYSNTKK